MVVWEKGEEGRKYVVGGFGEVFFFFFFGFFFGFFPFWPSSDFDMKCG